MITEVKGLRLLLLSLNLSYLSQTISPLVEMSDVNQSFPQVYRCICPEGKDIIL